MDSLVVEVTRGGRVESRHRVALALVDAAGRLRFGAGDVEARVFPRSAVKAMQALPFAESGAPERFGLGDDSLALACASHSGARRHVEAAAATLRAAGLSPDMLECGAAEPQDPTEARALARFGGSASALHNNCSGKHAGFLCLACAEGWETAGYVGIGHRVQRAARDAVAELTGAALDDSQAGIDGCSIPTYPIPLAALARGFARFGAGEGLGPKRAAAARRLRAAVARRPDLVSAAHAFDARAMALAGEGAFVKTGAEGIHAAALPALGLGIAVKCEDGASRAAETAIAAALAAFAPKLGLDPRAVEACRIADLFNRNGAVTGEVRIEAASGAALGAAAGMAG